MSAHTKKEDRPLFRGRSFFFLGSTLRVLARLALSVKRFVRLRTSRSSVRFDVVRVPGKKALVAILDVARCLKLMIFIRIDDQLGFAPQSLERLIHLLPTQNRDVPVDIAPNK